jgi:threonylcarbamoyladenosine tRNA methylthiotransferase MtaB
VIKERAARLRARGEAALNAHLQSLIGSTQSILMEKQGLGRTPGFAPVRLEDGGEPGAILRVSILSQDGRMLSGRADWNERAVSFA